MDSFISKTVSNITPTSGAFEDLFLVTPGNEIHFERMLKQSKFVAAAAKTEQKVVMEWIKHAAADIKMLTGAFVYFNVPKPCVCTFTGVEVRKGAFGPQVFAPWTKTNAASFYKLLGSVAALYQAVRNSDQIANGLGLESGFEVFGSDYKFTDENISGGKGFLINMFLADKGKELVPAANLASIDIAMNNLSITKDARNLKSSYKLIC